MEAQPDRNALRARMSPLSLRRPRSLPEARPTGNLYLIDPAFGFREGARRAREPPVSIDPKHDGAGRRFGNPSARQEMRMLVDPKHARLVPLPARSRP